MFWRKKKPLELPAAAARALTQLNVTKKNFERQQYLLTSILHQANRGYYELEFYSGELYSHKKISDNEILFLENLGYKVETKQITEVSTSRGYPHDMKTTIQIVSWK